MISWLRIHLSRSVKTMYNYKIIRPCSGKIVDNIVIYFSGQNRIFPDYHQGTSFCRRIKPLDVKRKQ